MKVILLQDVNGVGRKDDLKEAPDGYVRNFMLPRGLATVASLKMVGDWEARRAEREQARKVRLVELEKQAQALRGTALTFYLKVGEKNEIFGSVSGNDIEKALAEKGFAGARVKIERPMRELGEKKVEVDLGEGVRSAVLMEVLPEKN